MKAGLLFSCRDSRVDTALGLTTRGKKLASKNVDF
jgi:hypothetical protein